MPGLAILGAVALLAAGCLGTPQERETTGPDPPVQGIAPFVGPCQNALLFQLVPYAQTDDYLPPGFHPRDPQDFLRTPVAFGQAGVVFLALSCTDATGRSLVVASVGIFVEPPGVAGLEPGLFDFYEVDRRAEQDPFAAVLAEAAWPQHLATLSFVPLNGAAPALGDGAQSLVSATVRDDAGIVAEVQGAAQAPVPVGEGVVRFWHDGPRGLAYLAVTTTLDANVGSGLCQARVGTPLANFIGSSTCPVGEPVLATFPGLTINATAAFLPGVHAA